MPRDFRSVFEGDDVEAAYGKIAFNPSTVKWMQDNDYIRFEGAEWKAGKAMMKKARTKEQKEELARMLAIMNKLKIKA